MALLGNILWLVLGGWLLFIAYAVGAIIFFPAFLPLFRLALYSAWPFGRDVISRTQLENYRKLGGADLAASALDRTLLNVGRGLNLLWMLSFGWILALLHLVCSILNICLFWLLITIPNIGGHWKLISVAFMPFNKMIVPSEIAKEVRLGIARAKLGI